MDATRFDRLTKSLTAVGSRRGIFGLLAALPGAGGLLMDEVVSARQDRYRRSARRADRRNGKGGKKGKSCKLESRAQTCRGKCGIVRGNCKGPIDCGPCSCKPKCKACQTCDKETGTCVTDHLTVDEPCGPCKVCSHAGKCEPVQDEQCCGEPDGGMWCQDGACVAATATIQDCSGECNFSPDPSNPSIERCGQQIACPDCNQCFAQTGCSAAALMAEGPQGPGWYCVQPVGSGQSCSSSPCPPDEYCSIVDRCETLCGD
jgi:hypothetical protein